MASRSNCSDGRLQRSGTSSGPAIRDGTASALGPPIASAKRLSLAADNLDWLERKASEISDLHIEALKFAKRCFESLVSSLECQALAGTKLAECKGKLRHGQWLPWLEKYPRINDRRARRYMWIGQRWEIIAGELERLRKSDMMSDLDRLAAAREFITALHIAERIEAGERPEQIVIVRFADVRTLGIRWRAKLQAADVTTWSREERRQFRDEFRPIVEIYERCA
jgi:hypothetical protein